MEDFLMIIVLWCIIGLGVCVLIVVIGQIIKARVSAINIRSFEKLASELREENAKIITELTVMNESLSSINKMMKDIE